MSNRNKQTANKYNNKKGGGKQNNNKDREAMKPMDQDDPKFAKLNKYNDGNDPDYYFTSKELAEQAATFPFPYFLGNRNTIGNFNVPTVEVLFTNASPGVTKSDVSGNLTMQTGANMAAQKLYTRLSIASGRTASYQPNDVLMSILAANSLMEGIEYARRFFGIATTYSVRNRVFAWKILSMLDGNASMTFGQDFVEHLADYRMHLNMIITKMNQVPLFGDIGYVRKSMEMYQKVYMDETSETAQIYAFSPQSLWMIDETGDEGTVLKTVGVTNNTKFSNLLATLNKMADALLNSSTLNIVYADMFNYQAKFSANFVSLDYVLEGYSVIPEYNERVLQQIHNAVIVGLPHYGELTTPIRRTDENNVESDATTGLIVYNPFFPAVTPVGAAFFDFETSTPDLVDRVDNIKFAAIPGDAVTVGDHKYSYNDILPDHYVVRARIYGARPEDYANITSNRMAFESATLASTAFAFSAGGDYTGVATNLFSALIAKFDHNFLGVSYVGPDGSDVVTAVEGDLNYFTTMPKDHLDRINELEYQGLLELR